MAIATDRIDTLLRRAADLFAERAPIERVVRAIKEMVEPGFTVTGTHADAMAEDPFKTDRQAAIYLVDNANHCWTITDKPESANGVVIGQRDEED